MKIRPVILSGGSGTRLWPLSRKRHPKQFAQLLGQQSMLLTTLELLQQNPAFASPLIIANEDHKFFVLDAMVQAKMPKTSVILEPCGRNTAAAALIAALADTQQDELHLLLPSDHVIGDPQAFFAAVSKAAEAVAQGHIALFGISPTHPETGYGYIQPGADSKWSPIKAIARFKEKPDIATAEKLIADGALWNSGIFLYNPTILKGEYARLAPDDMALAHASLNQSFMDLGCRTLDKTSYEKLRNISFDHLIMEHTALGVVMPCVMGWSDVGSWQALWQLGEKNAEGNHTQGPVTLMDVAHSYVRSDGPFVGVIGLKDIAVVATKDAVLVMPRARSQDVKNLVVQLEADGQKSALEHMYVMRPWGHYEGVAKGDRFQVKHIVVHPGQALSLQMHHHRAEHWVVVAGRATVECDDKKLIVEENRSVFIPKGAKHRLSNAEAEDLHLVEVQSGDYLGEDDIVRFSDNYGRV